MRFICITTTALALSAAPAIAGVCPETFMASLNRAMVQIAADQMEGTISVVDADGSGFWISENDDQLVKFKVNEKTTFTLDGQKSTFKDALATGRHATVTYEKDAKDAAIRVDVVTKK